MVREHVPGPSINLVNKKGRIAEKGKIPENITLEGIWWLREVNHYVRAGSGSDLDPLCSGVTDDHPCYYTIENCVEHLYIDQIADMPGVDITRYDTTRTKAKIKKVGRPAGSAHRNYPDKRGGK